MSDSEAEFHSSDEDDYEGFENEYYFDAVEQENINKRYIHSDREIPPEEADFPRKVRKNENHDVEWVLVTKDEDLPEELYYTNLLTSGYYQSPKINPNCTKKLSSPLDSCYSFLLPLLELVVRHTNENLLKNGKKSTDFDEMFQLFLALMAMAALAPKGVDFLTLVSECRKTLKNQFGILATWPGAQRLADLRTHLRCYKKDQNNPDQSRTAKVSPIIESFNRVSENTISNTGSYSLDETLAGFYGRAPIKIKMPRKPANAGICYHNVSMVNLRYCETLKLAAECSDKKNDKRPNCQ